MFDSESTGKDVVDAFKNEIKGKTFVITGPRHGGIGGEAILDICDGSPKRLVLLGRSKNTVDPLISSIRAKNNSVSLDFVKCDLPSQKSVRCAAKQVLGLVSEIDVLINNAATLPRPYSLTVDGIESQFATNHLVHFLLTNLLIEKMSDPEREARVVMVSSSAHRYATKDFEDYNFSGGDTYNEWYGYVQSKAANVLFAQKVARRLTSHRVAAYSVHPGSITDGMHDKLSPEALATASELTRQFTRKSGEERPRAKRKTVQQGCETILVAALDPGLSSASGAYLSDCVISQELASPSILNPENGRSLWDQSEELVDQKFNWSFQYLRFQEGHSVNAAQLLYSHP